MEQKAKIKFSDGSFLCISEDQLLEPIVKHEVDGKISTSTGLPFTCWNHVHHGLIPCLTELLSSCEFFKEIDSDVAYKASAVVSIENL